MEGGGRVQVEEGLLRPKGSCSDNLPLSWTRSTSGAVIATILTAVVKALAARSREGLLSALYKPPALRRSPQRNGAGPPNPQGVRWGLVGEQGATACTYR